jgi:hypothetical protein
VPVVEGEHAVPGGMEAGGEPVGRGLLGRPRPACHHHARPVAAPVGPGSAVISAAAEGNTLPLYHQFADKTALFEAALAAVEADIARRLADAAAAAGLSDPVEVLRHAVRTWLDICVEPEILRIALIDGPSVLGWTHWREVCYRHVLGLVRVLLAQGIELGRIRLSP